MEIGDELQVLRLEHRLAATLSYDRQLVAPQERARLCQVRLAAGELRGEPLGIGHGRFHTLSGGRAGGGQRFLADAFRVRSRHIGLHRLLAGPRRGDLRMGLIDAGERALNPRVLEVALAAVVFERCLRRVDSRDRLRDLCAKVVVRQEHQLVSLANLLVVVHLHFTNESRRPSCSEESDPA